MKSWAMVLLSLVFFGVGAAEAQEMGQTSYKAPSQIDNIHKTGDLGVGVYLGAPSGVDVQWWMNEVATIRPTVAFQNGNAALAADYLYHFRNVDQAYSGNAFMSTFAPYIGIGAITAFGSGNNYFNRDISNFGLGARVPLGLEWLPHQVPVGVFGEIAPGFGFVPNAWGFFQADVGGRYYF